MIKQHFKNELVKLGYPADLTIEHSFENGQKDGIAFYGLLGVDSIQKLMTRLLGLEPTALNQAGCVDNQMLQKDIDNMLFVMREYGYGDDGIAILKNPHESSDLDSMFIDDTVKFSHFFLDLTSDEEAFLVDREAMRSAGIDDDMLDHWQVIWDRFVQALRADVKDVSKKLAVEGHKQVETTPHEWISGSIKTQVMAFIRFAIAAIR